MNIVTHFNSKEDILNYIDKCEQNFKINFRKCVDSILKSGEVRFIMLSGPTCSGKTTAAKMLTEALENAGHRVGLISIDDFFFNRADLDKRERLDYDSVAALDLELLENSVKLIRDYKPVDLPIYDFKYGRRSGSRVYKTAPGDVTIFEGIQAVYPEVVSLFDKRETKSIYISVSDEAFIEREQINGRNVRLMRRILRDYINRSTTPSFSLKLWKSVCENEDRAIIPNKDKCDYQIDSLLGYDFGVLKVPVCTLLKEVAYNDENIALARELTDILNKVDMIPEEYIPADSLFNEFVGK